MGQAARHILGVRHLRDPFRVDKTGGLDAVSPGIHGTFDQLELGCCAENFVVILYPISGGNLNDFNKVIAHELIPINFCMQKNYRQK